MQLPWTLAAVGGLMALVFVVGAAFGFLPIAAEIIAAVSTFAVAIYGVGTWKLYELERRKRERRTTRLFSRLLLLAAYVDLFVALIEVQLEKEDRGGSVIRHVLAPRVQSLVEQARTLYDDALETNERTLSCIGAVEINLAIVQMHLREAPGSPRVTPLASEKLESIAEHLGRVKEGLFEAASALPERKDSAIEDRGQYFSDLRDRVYEMHAGEDDEATP